MSALIFSRAVLNIVASSLAIVYLIKINNLVNENKSVYSNYVLAFLFMLNPYFYGQVRIWYPDSYLYIFTILATYFLILIYKEINYSNNVYFLFFILALGTSIKLTFFYFGIIIFIFFIYELFFIKRNIFWLLVKVFLLYFHNWSNFSNLCLLSLTFCCFSAGKNESIVVCCFKLKYLKSTCPAFMSGFSGGSIDSDSILAISMSLNQG